MENARDVNLLKTLYVFQRILRVINENAIIDSKIGIFINNAQRARNFLNGRKHSRISQECHCFKQS